MQTPTPQLIVIDEYPPNKPFLNPICKDTFQALPKIYGRKGKRRYFYNIQEIIKHEHTTFQRECCHMEIQRISRDFQMKRKGNLSAHLEIAAPKSGHCRKKNCECGKSNEKDYSSETKREQKPQAKLQKIILPHLTEIEELKQSESNHKIFKGRVNSMFSESKGMEARQMLMENRVQRLKELKQSRVSRSEYIQTQPIGRVNEPISKLPKKETAQPIQQKKTQPEVTQTKKKRYNSEPNQQDRPYYEYLQNDPKLKQGQDDTQNNFRPSRVHRANTADDQNLTISSISIKPQHSVSTVFHQFKKKQSSRNSNILSNKTNNKSQSVLSNGLFKIPQAEEYEDYLSKYAPMNPDFDLKKLLKKEAFHILPINNAVYFGEIVNEKKQGDGISVSEKEIYQGRYQNNIKKNGYERNRDGVYSGKFLNGKRHGKGKYVWNNGEQFEGEWKDGKKNGYGVWKSPKGDCYEGEWKDNRQHGKGQYVHAGGSKYRGYFKDFLKSGKGQEEFANGDKYTGMYEQGKPHGYGRYVWSNGDTYEGQFIDGSRQGQGTLRTANGEVYEGYFKNDMKHGKGLERYKSGQQFQGQFRDGQRFEGRLRTKTGAEITITAD